MSRPLPALPGSTTRPSRGNSCAKCNGLLIGRTMEACGRLWHAQCFSCSSCDTALEHVAFHSVTVDEGEQPLCFLCFHEAHGLRCHSCKTPIVDEEYVTLEAGVLGPEARSYHSAHFFCCECGTPFQADSSFIPMQGHACCERCHSRLFQPKCTECKRPVEDGGLVDGKGKLYHHGCMTGEFSIVDEPLS